MESTIELPKSFVDYMLRYMAFAASENCVTKEQFIKEFQEEMNKCSLSKEDQEKLDFIIRTISSRL